ncbi:MAG: flagellar FliJ family protein [Deltaproteobacteria bacterium]|nr:flagellar FliJ family protein [Deltaproteobacteria bacterium]
MNGRLKTVSKIARIIEHQKEVIELQLQAINHRQTLEQERLNLLEKYLGENIGRFEESLSDRFILNSEEVAFLFGTASTFFHKIERTKEEIERIGKELEAFQVLFREAYKKEKAVAIVQNKIIAQERRAEGRSEQKNMDSWTLSSRLRQ